MSNRARTMVRTSHADVEAVMAERTRRGVPISVRVPPEIARRIDKLIPKIEKDRTLSTFGQVNRSSVVKLVLLRGLEALEAQYGGK